METKYYSPESIERLEDAKIINGNPSGIISISHTPHKWAVNIYELMKTRTWFTSECDLHLDKATFANLPPRNRRAIELVLAQLATDDSVQTSQLPDVGQFITSPYVKAVLVRQAAEEFEHSNTYSIAADELVGDKDKIYDLHKYDKGLLAKNLAVSEMYEQLAKPVDEMTDGDKLMVAAANLVLERIVFPGGFAVIWSQGLPNLNKAIAFIERDETGTHVPIFTNIFRDISRMSDVSHTHQPIVDLVTRMTEVEIEWTKYVSSGLLGFSDQAIEMYIQWQANDVMKRMKKDTIYPVTDGGPLMALYLEQSMLSTREDGSKLPTYTNGFEAMNGNYALNSMSEDF